VFECHDPESSERGKGLSSFSQESSANHFLRIRGKKNWRGRKETEKAEERGRKGRKPPCRMTK